MQKIRNYLKIFLFTAAVAVLFSAGSSSSVEVTRQGKDNLLDIYQKNAAKLETNRFGFPLYVESFERNAVRYYFAILSFMNTLSYPEEIRFNMRISEWYDLASRYKKQFYDLKDKNDYLTLKAREHKNLVMLQRRIVDSNIKKT